MNNSPRSSQLSTGVRRELILVRQKSFDLRRTIAHSFPGQNRGARRANHENNDKMRTLGGVMKARNICLITAMAALSGCAAMQTAPGDQAVTAQKALYIVGDDAAPAMAQSENSQG